MRITRGIRFIGYVDLKDESIDCRMGREKRRGGKLRRKVGRWMRGRWNSTWWPMEERWTTAGQVLMEGRSGRENEKVYALEIELMYSVPKVSDDVRRSKRQRSMNRK